MFVYPIWPEHGGRKDMTLDGSVVQDISTSGQLLEMIFGFMRSQARALLDRRR
jgi:hypothetical protein